MMNQEPLKLIGSVNGVVQDDWTTIGEACKRGASFVRKYYKIGDTISVVVSGEGRIDYEIIGFGVQDKADGTGKAAISWFPKSLLKTLKYWNSTKTTSGGWAASDLRSYMNNDIFAKFPADLQSVITPVANPNDQGGTTTDKVWTVSKAECESGGIFNSKFGTNDQRLRKRKGSIDCWWTRTVYNSSQSYFVNLIGDIRGIHTNDNDGVAPGFAT